MRQNAIAWLAWLKAQTGADGFRFDAVKHFPPEVVGEALDRAMKPANTRYFAVGEFVGGTDQIDDWTARTGERAGTWDFPLRGAFADIVARAAFSTWAACLASRKSAACAPFPSSTTMTPGAARSPIRRATARSLMTTTTGPPPEPGRTRPDH
jgi:hypothetical protein